MNRCIVFHLCFACAEHLCILLGWLRRARRGTDLIAKKVLHRARNVFPPGPSQWTKKLLECIFLIEGADILHTAMDFSLLLLHPPPLSPIDSSKNVSWRHAGPYKVHYTLFVKPSAQDAEQPLLSRDTPSFAQQPSLHAFSSSSPLLFVILSHKCAPNLISSYNKCIHTPCNISKAVISLHHKMSHLSPLYFSSVPAREEGGAHTARALLLRLKPDGGCLSNACVRRWVCVVCICLCGGKRDKRGREVGEGIKPVSWGLLSMSGRRWGGVLVLTGQSPSFMI